MQVPLWLVLIIAFTLGLIAAWISQFTVARKGLEANAKARTLRENVNSLVERNSARRDNLKRRQEILDKYLMMDIEHQKGQLDDQALKDAIGTERKRITALTKAIGESENIIVENRTLRVCPTNYIEICIGYLFVHDACMITAFISKRCGV